MWNELTTSDGSDATNFYTGLLGLDSGEMEGAMEYTLLKAAGGDVAGVMQITEEMGPVPPHWGCTSASPTSTTLPARPIP